MSEREHIFLIDGSGYIFRAYHALPPLSRPSDGTPVGAVYGFCNMLYKLLEDSGSEAPTHLAVIFDAGKVTFRNALYPAYKANRPEPPEDLIPQFALIRDAVRAFDVPCIELDNYEADDIIATYARQARERGATVIIVSSDKDLMQLVDDSVMLLDTMKNKRLGIPEVFEKFGVAPEKVVDVQSLAGDSVDNVPGVPGIGIKTAAQLINEYGDLDTLLARAGEIKQPKRRESLVEFAEQARISRTLVTLDDRAPVPEGIDDIKVRPIDYPRAIQFVEMNGFKSLAVKLASRAGGGSTTAGPKPAEAPQKVETTGYDTILSLDALDMWIDAAAAQGFVALDTETTSVQPMLAALVGVSLAIEPGKACYIPIGHTGSGGAGTLDLDGDRPQQLAKQAVLARLKPLLEDPGVLKIGQNIKYDAVMFAKEGITVAPIDDTMLISYVLEGGAHGHGMDELSELHLGHKTIKFADVAGSGKTQVTFDRVPIDKATAYAAEDADVTLRLHQVLKPRLAQEHLVTVYETLERPLSPILGAMEQEGIKVDREKLVALSKEFGDGMAALEKEVYRLAGREFNIGSPKQLGELIFDELNLGASTRAGKSGARSTGADVLEDLAAQGHDLPARVLDWRQLSKLKSTYTDSLQLQIDPVTQRIHTCYSMASTTTGRLSSTEPNLQNIPIRTSEGRKIRQAFIPKSGHKLMSADYSQIELRILAHMADIAALKQAFADGLDIHAMTASEVLGIPLEGMPPEQRRRAKAINFGIIYGISAFGLARQLSIPQSEAKAYITRYFDRFPGIRAYMDETIVGAREKGYVTTLFGRRVHVRSINDKNPAMRQFGERASINAPIQGSAADIIRRAMVRMPGALEKAGLRTKMLLQVHDELVFEVPEAELGAAGDLVRTVMEGAAAPAVNLSVPLTVGVGIGGNWDEAH